ncbi:hypothetical protein Moror_3129 [Moniliophthora roreri MCA 2997]|uniref:Nudix hydrolase domain-containing protein n=2 Tax=Moniliophthora roreri TaxID=221103 RepID=V2YA72_MONRO|nr:hypothetical protein Moror_3129 [Moniliophthora roreri MCA 2997]KAI3621387.1 hypothetical protein WG66_000037 [Moniliophthora roreri]
MTPSSIRAVLLLSISFFLISFKTLRAAAAAQASTFSFSCEDAARRLGQPVDGWKVVKNRKNAGAGGERCVRDVANLTCEALENLYYHPETRIAGCCQADGSVTWQDEEAKLGFCCAPGHDWTGDISSGEGGCCPTGMIMVEGMCVDKATTTEGDEEKGKSGGCGCHSSSKTLSSDEPMVSAAAVEASSEVVEDFQDDELDPTDIGIRYGRCYTLGIADGRQIGSNRENAIYTPGGLFQDIPFRVCSSTSDCARRERDEELTSKDSFVLEDQMGRYNDAKGTMGWVTSTLRGVLKMMFTTDGDDASVFVAKRNASCVDGDRPCGLLLRGLPVELRFNETECWVEESAHTSFDRERDEL